MVNGSQDHPQLEAVMVLLTPLQFVTCNLNPKKCNVSCGQNSTKWGSSLELLTPTPKVSWWIVCRLIGMLFVSFTIMEILCEDDSPRMNLFFSSNLVDVHKTIDYIRVSRTTQGIMLWIQNTSSLEEVDVQCVTIKCCRYYIGVVWGILAHPSTWKYALTKFIWGWNYYVVIF